MLPKAPVIGVVGVLALLANGAVALMLFRFRAGDANMRSVCVIMAGLGITGGCQIMRQALSELATGGGLRRARYMDAKVG
jgi:hypothetical protein